MAGLGVTCLELGGIACTEHLLPIATEQDHFAGDHVDELIGLGAPVTPN
jgi:hypothetical protein